MIFLIAYVIGYIWLWRYHVGYALDEVTYSGDADGSDFGFALFFGTAICLLWPITLMGRGVYVLWQKNMADDTSILANFFPGPKEIETKQEKQQRIAKEQAAQIKQRQREINEHERANDLELTRWTA